jgi:hypothetical protein
VSKLNASTRPNHDHCLSAYSPDPCGDSCRALRQVSSIPQGSGLWAGLPNRAQAEHAVRRNRIGIPEGSAKA